MLREYTCFLLLQKKKKKKSTVLIWDLLQREGKRIERKPRGN